MSESAHRARQPKPGSDWSIRGVSRRCDWSDEVGACAYCGAAVDMRGEHYDAELVRDRPSGRGAKRSIEYERYVFCDDECATAWRAEQ